MDRTDPDNFDSLANERRTEVRGLDVEHFPGGDNPWARGHEFALLFKVGPSTDYRITANAAELRRWSMILAEAALRFAEDPPDALPDDAPKCPACRGDVHVDLSGAVWSTTAAAAERARALHRPVEYRPGGHYANYGPPKFHRRGAPKPEPLPEVVTVCEACQNAADSAYLSESGGHGGYEIVAYPCPTIRAMDGEAE